MKNRFLVCGLTIAALCASAGAAESILFPNADSSGDLASLAAWGLDAIPSESDVFISASGTYIASEDVSFNGFMPKSDGVNMIFDLTPSASGGSADAPRRITVGSRGLYVTNRSNVGFALTGGIWDFQNSASISLYGPYGKNNKSATFTDVVVTNLANLTGGYGGSNHRITIGSGAKIYASRCLLDGYQSNTSTFEIKDGGCLYANISVKPGFALAQAGSNAGGRNTLRVTGEGSKLIIEGSGQIAMPAGNVATGHLFHVTSGGYAKIANTDYKFIGGQSSAKFGLSQRWVIDEGGVLETSGSTVLLGHNGGFSRVEVLNGGVWTNSSVLSIGSDYQCAGNNSLIISNGLYHGGFPYIGRTNLIPTNNVVQIMGSNSRFEISNTGVITLFPNSHHNKFILSDGAAWTNNTSSGMRFSDQNESCSNIFAVVGGSTYYSTNKLWIANANYDVCSNILVVADGSLVHALSLTSSAVENGIVVSNATVETEENIVFSQSSSSTQIKGFSNCWMRVEGASPKVMAGTSFSILNSSSLRFVLPESGYDDGLTPITCGTEFSVAAKSRVLVDGVEMLACAKKRPFNQVLVEADDEISLGDGVLADANAYIAAQADKSKGSELRLSADGRQLLLHVSYPNGTMLLVR